MSEKPDDDDYFPFEGSEETIRRAMERWSSPAGRERARKMREDGRAFIEGLAKKDPQP